MREIEAFEAKNRLDALLDLVEQSEEVTITRHGKPVARLVAPAAGSDGEAARAAASRIRAGRRGVTLGDVTPDSLSWHPEDRTMPMKNPPHPGEVIRELCIEPSGRTVTATAEALGVNHKALSALLDGLSSISFEMAIRLCNAFGGSIESWLTQQMEYDLAS